MEWKVVYVGSAENHSFDQILDEVIIGPVPVGTHKFLLQTDAPDPTLIPQADLLGITVILVTCSYREQEFARVGYYVRNEYIPFDGYDVEVHGEVQMQSPIDVSKVHRQIVAEKPRVTRFPIQWSGPIEKSESSSSGISHDRVTATSAQADSLDSPSEDIAASDSDMDMDMDGEEEHYMSLSPLSSPDKTNHSQGEFSAVVSPDWSNGIQTTLMAE